MSLKVCKTCHIEKPLDEFGVHSILKSGIHNDCKKCNSEKAKKWASKNPEKVKNTITKWRESNKEKISEYNREYRIRNAASVKKSAEEYRAANKDKKKQLAAEWYAANTKLACDIAAEWRKANPDKVRQLNRNWRSSNPDAVRLIHQNRRAKKRENGGVLSKGLAQKLFKLQKGMCPCCKKSLGKDYELDHIYPIALGGANSDENIQLLRKQCNRRKRAKHPVDFMQSRGFLL